MRRAEWIVTVLLLLLIGILAMVSAGRAGENEQVKPPIFGQNWAIHDGKRISDVATCLATMEAAMRAIGPFLPSEMPIIVTDDLIYLNQLARAEREVERLQAKGHALRQWEKAKACWGKP